MPIELSTEEVVLGGGAGEEISLASVMSKLTNIINRRLPSCTNVYSAAQRTLAEMYGQQTWAVPYALLAPLAASVLLESGQSSNVFRGSPLIWAKGMRRAGKHTRHAWREDAEWCNEVRPVHERHVAAILSKFGTVVLTSAGGLPVAEAILVGSIVEEAMRTTSESAVDSAKAAFRASWENILSTVDSWANEQLKRDQASEQDTGSDEVVATSAPDEVVATQLLDA